MYHYHVICIAGDKTMSVPVESSLPLEYSSDIRDLEEKISLKFGERHMITSFIATKGDARGEA